MATLVGRHRRSRRGNRCSNARLSRSPSAPGGQIVRTRRRGRRDHLQNSWRRPAVRLDAGLFGAIAVGSADRDFERAILHDQPRRAASRRRRDPRRARPLELPGDGEKPAGPGGHPPERGGAGSRRRVRVVIREIARRTAGANQIIDVDISPYLLHEAEALTKQAGLANRISFQEGHAEAIPLADDSVDVALSFTAMEEGDADRMLSELVRVTRPGGRIAAIVRSLDMPPWTNAAFSPAVRAKVDIPGRGDVAPRGCADASLYERFRRAGLVGLTCFSQLASVDASQASRIAVMKQRILASLTKEESAEWKAAVAQAEADGTFFISTPHHCAVGIKPPVTVA